MKWFRQRSPSSHNIRPEAAAKNAGPAGVRVKDSRPEKAPPLANKSHIVSHALPAERARACMRLRMPIHGSWAWPP